MKENPGVGGPRFWPVQINQFTDIADAVDFLPDPEGCKADKLNNFLVSLALLLLEGPRLSDPKTQGIGDEKCDACVTNSKSHIGELKFHEIIYSFRPFVFDVDF